MRTNAVMNICLMNYDPHRKAKCINHNVFLTSFDLLVSVDATVGSNMMGRFDASGIYDSYAGRILPAHQLANDDMEGVNQLLEDAFCQFEIGLKGSLCVGISNQAK